MVIVGRAGNGSNAIDFVVSSSIIVTPMKYRDLLRRLQDDGWQHVRTTGSHLHFKHASKPGLVTVPAGGKLAHDVASGTLRSILRQAGLT